MVYVYNISSLVRRLSSPKSIAMIYVRFETVTSYGVYFMLTYILLPIFPVLSLIFFVSSNDHDSWVLKAQSAASRLV